MDTYRNPFWPTRDRVVPVRLFYPFLEAIGNVSAAEELQQYFATVLASAQVWAPEDKQGTIQRAVKALRAMAYPNEAPAPEKPLIVPASVLESRESRKTEG